MLWDDGWSVAYVKGGGMSCNVVCIPWHTHDRIFFLKGVMIQGEIVITPGSME